MRIFGDFKDLHNNTIHVEIYKQETGVAVEYEIDNILDNTHHFCFDGKSPVKITRKFDDLFEPIVSTTCKIKLRSNIWCGDLLFSNGVGDIVCKVTRTLNNTNEEKLLFIGYVQPLSFNQNINKMSNIIDINCVDILGFFKDRYLSTGLTGSQSESAWQSAISNAQYRKFINIFKYIGLYDYTFTLYNTSYNTKLYIDDNGKDSTTNTLQISDNLWLGDGADDETSLYDILVEIMRYMNCRIISINGLEFYIIGNDEIGSVSNFKLYSNNTSTSITFSDENILPKEDIANEQVTMDECYNKISVKCDLETVDNVVHNILDEENLYSDYNNRQKLFVEMAAPTKYALYLMIRNGGVTNFPGITDSDLQKCWSKDWYIRVMKSKYWNLKNNFEDDTMAFKQDTTTSNKFINVRDSDGVYINQMKSVYDLGLPRVGNPLTTNRMGAYLIEYASGQKRTIHNFTSTDSVTSSTCLVIPINGLAYGPNVDLTEEQRALAEESAMQGWEQYLERYNDDPMVVYDGESTINLKPSDNNTTNYILISGSMTCQPIFDWRRKYNVNDDSWKRSISANASNSLISSSGSDTSLLEQTQASVDTNARWYYHSYYDKEYTNIGTPVRSTIPTYYSWCPFIECDDLKDFKYKGSQNITRDEWSTVDIIEKVPLLCCRLSIGGKYVNEVVSSSGHSTYEWSDDPNSVFSIGFDPEIDDFIIGNKVDIKNDVKPEWNIEGKGLAIPITYSDNISGKVHFEIVGPYNTMWEDVTHETHSAWSSFWNGYPRSKWHHVNYSLLNHISSIIIDKFEITVTSDNAKNATMNNGDLIYYSEDTMKYSNPQELEFKIVTALTSDEAAEMNVATGISYNNPTLTSGDLYTTSYQNRPEYRYIYTMYRLASTPKKIIEYNCNLGNNDISEMYRSVYSCDLMSHLNVSNFSTIVTSNELDLKNDRQKINLREI